jgi:hypothetical protein
MVIIEGSETLPKAYKILKEEDFKLEKFWIEILYPQIMFL